MGLSGEQKRTARKQASAARTTTPTAARKSTGKAAASSAAPARGRTQTLKKRGVNKAPAATLPKAASRGARPSAGAKGAKAAKKNGAARAVATKAAAKNASAKKGSAKKASASKAAATKVAATRAAATKAAAARAVSRNGASANGASNGLLHGGVDYLNPTSIERRKSPISGWGVFALEDIAKNKRIVYYAGERISAKESGPREEKYLENGHIWCFQLNRAWVIDAAIGGNIARFVNHACKPNCYTHIVDGTIWIRAGKHIRKGDELTYNYYTEGQAEIPCKCVPGCQGML